MGGMYFIHPFDVGWKTNFAPLTCAEYYHPANFTCSALDHIPYHAYHQRELLPAWHIPSQHSTYHIASSSSAYPISFHSRYYLSSLMSSKAQSTSSTANQGVFSLDSTNTCPRRYYPRIHPSESDTPAPNARTPNVFLQTLHPRPLHLSFPPFLASEHRHMSDLKQPAGSISQ